MFEFLATRPGDKLLPSASLQFLGIFGPRLTVESLICKVLVTSQKCHFPTVLRDLLTEDTFTYLFAMSCVLRSALFGEIRSK